MANILINGLNAKSGGGKSILVNYLSILSKKNKTDKYFVLTPSNVDYSQFENHFIEIIQLNKLYSNLVIYPIVYTWVLPRLLRHQNIDVVLNLADIPIKTTVKQIFLFDWPYAVYPDSQVWDLMNIKSKIIRRSKLFLFKAYSGYVDIFISQTRTIKERLSNIYGFDNITIIPNGVSEDNIDGGVYNDFNLPMGDKLLYLTYYYPHKNLEVLLPLAVRIKKHNLPYKIITTIDSTQGKGAKYFLDEISKKRLEDVIINIGSVEMKHVSSLYKQCDGLLMPTLLETYGLPYVEAMYNDVAILTSDLDFARDVCGNAAEYFIPTNSKSIFDSIEKVFNDKNLKKKLVSNGNKKIKKLPTWNDTVYEYSKIIDRFISDLK
ncbi:glycosyltransferase [Gracilimonas halophila]|uniref:Glycosyltransferase n=1 Tax=Gracilimonas halophila TaxID=1834464 RepID=A0ABW5JN76_9BACT